MILFVSLQFEKHFTSKWTGELWSRFSDQMVKSIVDEALAQFSADRVGLPDFALESAGEQLL